MMLPSVVIAGLTIASGSADGRPLSEPKRMPALDQVVDEAGVSEIDRVFLQGQWSRRYRPAQLDGRPIEVWLSGTSVEVIQP